MTPAQTQTPVYGKPPLCLEVQRGVVPVTQPCVAEPGQGPMVLEHTSCVQTHLAGPPARRPQGSHTLWPFGQ